MRHKTQPAAGVATQALTIFAEGQERSPLARASRTDQIRLDGLTEPPASLNDRLVALSEHNRRLADELNQLRVELRGVRSRTALKSHVEPRTSARARPGAAFADVDERRRMERDLHDGVQTELVSLLVRLKLIEDDPDVPPALAGKLAALTDHAIAALDSMREIAHGIYPLDLFKFGLLTALRSMAARAPLSITLEGTAPRSSEDAEAAVYFAASQAIQNVAKHAGGAERVALRLRHESGTLHHRIADDGRGFDPAQTAEGTGLRNIRNRIQTLGGTVSVDSSPGRGTVISVSLPWPPRAEGGKWAR